jgi:hypothetical protein
VHNSGDGDDELRVPRPRGKRFVSCDEHVIERLGARGEPFARGASPRIGSGSVERGSVCALAGRQLSGPELRQPLVRSASETQRLGARGRNALLRCRAGVTPELFEQSRAR